MRRRQIYCVWLLPQCAGTFCPLEEALGGAIWTGGPWSSTHPDPQIHTSVHSDPRIHTSEPWLFTHPNNHPYIRILKSKHSVLAIYIYEMCFVFCIFTEILPSGRLKLSTAIGCSHPHNVDHIHIHKRLHVNLPSGLFSTCRAISDEQIRIDWNQNSLIFYHRYKFINTWHYQFKWSIPIPM